MRARARARVCVCVCVCVCQGGVSFYFATLERDECGVEVRGVGDKEMRRREQNRSKARLRPYPVQCLTVSSVGATSLA